MLNNSEITEKLATAIKEGPYKTSFFLEKLQISNASLSLALSGKRKWTCAEFVFLCGLFNFKVEDFLTDDDFEDLKTTSA